MLMVNIRDGLQKAKNMHNTNFDIMVTCPYIAQVTGYSPYCEGMILLSHLILQDIYNISAEKNIKSHKRSIQI